MARNSQPQLIESRPYVEFWTEKYQLGCRPHLSMVQKYEVRRQQPLWCFPMRYNFRLGAPYLCQRISFLEFVRFYSKSPIGLQ
ncbi:hypothetical protein TNCV_1809231 [Trichonephila clavipes]|nr:hypothetical protein TNCV_1809231 [Trichonephila clavipes]